MTIFFTPLIKEALTKSPLLNKHRLLKKFKALVSGEYDGTGGGGNDDDDDPFRQFDFSGRSQSLSMMELQKDMEADWCNHDYEINPYPAIAHRKYHGKKMIPLVKQSDGFEYLDVFRIFGSFGYH